MTYRTISPTELASILDKHKKWLASEGGGEQANLSSANLSYANLRFADLSYANLSSANLSSANLSYADLSYANLLIFQFNRHTAYFTFDGTLRIGCECMPISEWLNGFEEVGKSNNYSAQEIFAYGNFIKLCVELFQKNAMEFQ
jgi:hypothetical protein